MKNLHPNPFIHLLSDIALFLIVMVCVLPCHASVCGNAPSETAMGSGDGRIHIIPSLSQPSIKNGDCARIQGVIKAAGGVAKVEARIVREYDGQPSWEETGLLGLPVATFPLTPDSSKMGGVNAGATMGIWQAEWQAEGLREGYYRVAITVTDRAGHSYTDNSLVFSDPIVGNNVVGTTDYPNGEMRFVDAVRLEDIDASITSSVIDTTNGYVYFTINTSPSKLAKIKLGSDTEAPALVGIMTLDEGESNVVGSMLDNVNGCIYLLTDTNPLSLVKLAVGAGDTLPTRLGAMPLPLHQCGMLVDSANGYAYFVGSGHVLKYALAPGATLPTLVGDLTLPTEEANSGAGAIDAAKGYAYLTTHTASGGCVVKIALGEGSAPPTRIGALALTEDDNPMTAAGVDSTHGYGYFSAGWSDELDSTLIHVTKVALGDGSALPTRVGEFTIKYGTSFLGSCVIDEAKGYAFFGTASASAPATVFKVALGEGDTAPSCAGLVRLVSNDQWLLGGASAIDIAAGYAYFGDVTHPPGTVSRVKLYGDKGQKGYVKVNSYTLPESGVVESVSFYSHAASGNVRLALYSGATGQLLWESGAVPNTADNAWLTVPISSGVPSSLALDAGGYSIAWQTDSDDAVPSYTPNAACMVFPWTFGPFPSLEGGYIPDGYFPTAEQWSTYFTYTVPGPGQAPIDPSATAIGADTITWMWIDVSTDETGFKVYDDPGAELPTTLQTTTTADCQSWPHNGLTPNTQYAFQVAAVFGGGDSAKTPNYARYTLAGPPSLGNNIVCDKTTSTWYAGGTTFTFSNPAGFGAGTHGGSAYKVSAFKYVWDTQTSYTFTGTEAGWNANTLTQTPTASGIYYLHLMSVNGEGVAGGTFDFGPFWVDAEPPAIQISSPSLSMTNVGPVTYTVTFSDNGGSGVSAIALGAADIHLITTGTAAGVAEVSGSGLAQRTVTIHDLSGSGTISIEIVVVGAAMDGVGHQSAMSNASTPFTFDAVPPTATITLDTPTATTANAVAFYVHFNEPLTAPLALAQVSLSPDALAGSLDLTGSGVDYTVTVTMTDPDANGTAGITLAGGILTDLAGNFYAGGESALYTIHNWPGLTDEPASAKLYLGQSYTLTVEGDFGPVPASFQWKHDTGAKAIVDGPTTANWPLVNITEADSGTYWCEITYDGAVHASEPAVLDVRDHVQIILPPQDATVQTGATHTFTALATGGYAPLNYIWKKADNIIEDAITADYTTPPLTKNDAGTYTVEAYDANSDRQSASAELTVIPGMPLSSGTLLALCSVLVLLGARKAKVRRH